MYVRDRSFKGEVSGILDETIFCLLCWMITPPPPPPPHPPTHPKKTKKKQQQKTPQRTIKQTNKQTKKTTTTHICSFTVGYVGIKSYMNLVIKMKFLKTIHQFANQTSKTKIELQNNSFYKLHRDEKCSCVAPNFMSLFRLHLLDRPMALAYCKMGVLMQSF